MHEFAGRVAFITGAASGIGLGIARACAEAGMRVVLADRDGEHLEDAAGVVSELGADVMTLPMDVTDRDAWASATARVPETLGPVQLLVNNAGVSALRTPFEGISPALWDRMVAINLTGIYNGIHFFLEGMHAAGGGHIVSTASMAGLVNAPRLAPYAATKAAVIALSEVLREELAGAGIGVSVLCPGGVQTQLWRTSRVDHGLPDQDFPSPELGSASFDPASMDPYEVGRRVLDGIAANDFYIFTHPEYRSSVAMKHAQVLAGFDRAEAFSMERPWPPGSDNR
jgi:NAD(P)-dependent dehydrogenase (short-subunit alcohol dehydrogenase family)